MSDAMRVVDATRPLYDAPRAPGSAVDGITKSGRDGRSDATDAWVSISRMGA